MEVAEVQVVDPAEVQAAGQGVAAAASLAGDRAGATVAVQVEVAQA